MNAGSIRRQGVRVYYSPAETQADTGWIFFREENHHVEINARRSKRAVTSQPSPTTVPELSQTRERVRRRHDCKPPTFAETLSSLAGRPKACGRDVAEKEQTLVRIPCQKCHSQIPVNITSHLINASLELHSRRGKASRESSQSIVHIGQPVCGSFVARQTAFQSSNV